MFFHWEGDVLTGRQIQDFSLNPLPVDFQPTRNSLVLVGIHDGLERFILTRLVFECDNISLIHLERGNVDIPIIDSKMPMGDQLASMASGVRKPDKIDDIIQPSLQCGKKIFSSDTSFFLSSQEKKPELFLRHPVISFQLLFLSELKTVSQDPSPHSSVLSRRIKPPLYRTIIGETLVSLQEKLDLLSSTEAADRLSVS